MRKFLTSLVLLMLVLGLSSCSQVAAPKKAQQVYDAVLGASDFQELTAMDLDMTAILLDVDVQLIEDFAVGLDASRYTPEALFVISAKDQAGKKTLETALQAYLDQLTLEYRDYRPKELPKLEGAKVQSQGLQVVLMVAPDAQKAEEALKAAWK